MSVAVLEQLHDAVETLHLSLEGDDPSAIDAATVRVNEAVLKVRSVGAWRDEAAVRQCLARLVPLLSAARVRVSVLSDQARQRIAMLAVRGASNAPLTYGR